MPKKALASLNVVINAVTSPLFRGLSKASKRVAAFGARMKAVGRSISMNFSLPFAAVGIAGAKMAIDLDKNMTKINTLVGISKKEVAEFSREIMGLSGEVAQAPADLAEGLFFLTSAGLRGANAMETLEQVSKGVAIGLGEQADLAKVAAAAQNAYGADTLSASDALDAFGMAVRTGMFESADLAESLGTQVGMAAELGISFDELLANVSAYTRTTGDAKSATTGFGGVMMAFAKETAGGEKALESVNLSYEGLRKMLQEKGLQETLFAMKDAFAENGVQMTEFFGKSQAVKNIMGVLGEQGDNYKQILEDMGDSTGMVSEAFDTVSGNTGFKMEQSLQTMKNAAQELGVMLMPIFTKIVEGATSLVKVFTQLDSGQKTLVVAAGALLAFAGPMITMLSSLFSWGGLVVVILGIVGVALGTIVAVVYSQWPKIEKALVDTINWFRELYNESVLFRGIVESIIVWFGILGSVFGGLYRVIYKVLTEVGKLFLSTFKNVGSLLKAVFTGDVKGIKKSLSKLAKSLKEGHTEIGKEIGKQAKNIGKTAMEKMQEAAEKVKDNKKLEPIDFDDIVEAVKEGAVSMGSAYLDELKKTPMWDLWGPIIDKAKGGMQILKDLMGGAGGVLGGVAGGEPEGDTPEDPIINSEGTSKVEQEIQKRKNLIERYLEWAEGGYDEWAGKIGEVWGEIEKVASQVLNGIGNLMSAQHEKAMTELDNENKTKQMAFDADFEREQMAIENSTMTQEQKDEALTKLKEKFDQRQESMDKAADAKKKALMAKQAKRDKAMKIASAIMATAQAVVQALTAGPILGPIMAAIVGGLGAAQVAAIAATPIPLAKGGLAFGPTQAIVGDNVGAAHDPEVIAPLSKLKGMLGTDMALNVAGVVKGNDIYLSNRNTDEQRERYI